MADGIELNLGSGGSTVSTDDIAGVHYARTKIVIGADGSNDGDVASGNPLPIAGAVTNAGTFAVQVDGNGLTALQLIDDIVYIDDADWTDGTSKHALVGGLYQSTPQTVTDGDVAPFNITANGALHVAVQNTLTVASHAVTNAGTFAVQVDSALPAGTNAIGKLAANSGVDIGDVDVTAVVPGTGATNLGKAVDSAAGATDTVVGVGAVRDDSLSSITPAEGDYTNLLVNSNGALWCAISGTVTVAAHAVTNAGTFVVQENGAALTALQLIDDAVFAEDSAHQSADKGFQVLSVRQDTAAALSGTDGDYQPFITDASGRLHVAVGNTVTVASHAVTNAGTFAVQVDGNALTALQLIDDVVFADDAAFTLGTSKGVMVMGFAGTQSVDANDAAALACTTAGALRVNVENTLTVSSHAVTNAGTFAVQVDGNALTALQLIDDTIFTDDAAFTPGTSKVSAVGFQADEASTDSVDEGDIGCPRMTLDRKVIVTPLPHTAGGCTIFRSIDLDETEEEVKATAGQVYGIFAINTTNATLFLKFYNATTGNTTVGTTTPVLTLPVPGNNDTDGAGFYISLPVGIEFTTAITVACTTGVADNDTTGPGANGCIVQVFYK